MTPTALTIRTFGWLFQQVKHWRVPLPALLAGGLLPLSFAPFHLPGFAILSLSLLFAMLQNTSRKRALHIGFFFGLGYFGVGISWVFVSIHDYGHLNNFLAGLITLLFIIYLSIYPALVGAFYQFLINPKACKMHQRLGACLVFSALWSMSEYLRATFLGGFPWLLIGFGQMDSPLKFLLPIVGLYGLSFITSFAAGLLTLILQASQRTRVGLGLGFVLLILTPGFLKHLHWSVLSPKSISVGVIQENLSMRDKWDESIFWDLLKRYHQDIQTLLGHDLIVLPESAISVPAHYISDVLGRMDHSAKQASSAIMLGIPEPTAEDDETYYYNALIALGAGQGSYIKQQLVPFGEYTPSTFKRISKWLQLPDTSLIKPGPSNQPLVSVKGHLVASLICYEVAYPSLVRQQLPAAEWLVLISDAGWFGHSFAMYQQQQMAQALSLQTGRFQVFANNDGLSAVINDQGEILAALPAFSAGTLTASLQPATGMTPWLYFSDMPALSIALFILILGGVFRFLPHLTLAARDKRRYS